MHDEANALPRVNGFNVRWNGFWTSDEFQNMNYNCRKILLKPNRTHLAKKYDIGLKQEQNNAEASEDEVKNDKSIGVRLMPQKSLRTETAHLRNIQLVIENLLPSWVSFSEASRFFDS